MTSMPPPPSPPSTPTSILTIPWPTPSFTNIPPLTLSAAGLITLADLNTVAVRTALTGTSTYLDSLIICPGLHRQASAVSLNGNEYPACGALTTGYVFRVENPATVLFLQKVGQTGELTTLTVREMKMKTKTKTDDHALKSTLSNTSFMSQKNASSSLISTLAYATAVSLTLLTLTLLFLTRDIWALTFLSILITTRVSNTYLIRRRTQSAWHGQREPGVRGDLLVLLSQDRWVRIRGLVDDLKAVTSGQWLREESFIERSIAAAATLSVYANVALASHASELGQVVLLVLLVASAGLLAIANEFTDALVMHGCKVEVSGERKVFGRRLELVEALLLEEDRNEEAMRAVFTQMGMTVPKKDKAGIAQPGKVTM